jgi:hypothetical protein
MYENPSIHFELARQRQDDMLRQAKKDHLRAELRSQREPADYLGHVRSAFAGILAAVSGLAPKARTVQQPGLNPA